ncbi:MAG TPA: OmpA family protein [Stellaceae bacterium]|jgi:flagellar motor protein MotB|nr:OmpA family protein [Stellaceae bacterium]
MRLVPVSRFVALLLLTALAACTGSSLNQPRSYLVYFDNDSATLTPDAQRIIGTIVTGIKDTSPSKVAIAGRADGSTAHDATLADQRAVAVMQALTQQGVSASKLEKEADAPPSGVNGVAAHQVVVTLVP